MSKDRRKEVVRHLTDEELDRLLSEADNPKVVRGLVFIKNLYEGDTLKEAADRVGKAERNSNTLGTSVERRRSRPTDAELRRRTSPEAR